MTVDPIVGCVFRPQNPPERLTAAARAADDVGVEEIWLWEDCFLHGGLTAAAIALAGSERVRIGVGVLPVPLRNVALTAMEIATLERAFPGRLRVGVGHGVQDWMSQVGARVASPLTLLREYATALHRLLRGDTVTVAGRYVTLTEVRLDWPPPAPVDVLLGATGPKTLALAGEVAAGTVLTGGTSPDGVRDAVAVIRAHAPDPDAHRVVTYVPVDGDAAALADAVRRWHRAGSDTVVLEPPVDADGVSFIRAVGDGVLPALRG